jgi:cobyrinic acid a,c-diamide synthase
MAGTFGALVHGLRTWRPGLHWAGVFANRVGSGRHAEMLEGCLDADAAWLGHLPDEARFGLPERHLGLTSATEVPDALARLDALADALAGTRLGRRTLNDWPRWTPPACGPLLPRARPLLAGRTVALAHDAAFAFVYEANVDVLRELGAKVVRFSPIAGDPLPPSDALWLPGGYPELHADRLSSRADLRAQLRAHVDAGRPVWAECGGMMALFERLQTAEGRIHAMWGLLPGSVTVGRGLAALGPQQLALGGDVLRGHTFHWSRCETPLGPHAHCLAGPASVTANGEPVYQHGMVRASYFHAWFASSPAFTARLFLPQALPAG